MLSPATSDRVRMCPLDLSQGSGSLQIASRPSLMAGGPAATLLTRGLSLLCKIPALPVTGKRAAPLVGSILLLSWGCISYAPPTTSYRWEPHGLCCFFPFLLIGLSSLWTRNSAPHYPSFHLKGPTKANSLTQTEKL